MTRNTFISAAAMALALLLAMPSHAISEGYRKSLEARGCTQVQDARGECPPPHQKQHIPLKEHDFSQADADRLVGKSISSVAETLITDGWRANNGKWRRGGHTLSLGVRVRDGTVTSAHVR